MNADNQKINESSQIYNHYIEPNGNVSLPSHVREAVAVFSHRIRTEFHNRILQIILYGSYARGDYHAESDVDILILTTDESWDIKKQIMDTGFDLYPEYGVFISAKVMSLDRFQSQSGFLFIKEVTREGVALV